MDGLPVDLLERELPRLPFVRERLPHAATAVSCFPSTTGPAYFPFLAGCTPGRANVPGIRWFDRTVPTRTRFPHRGLRSYVGPDARRLQTDTAVRTILAEDAWPASSPVNKDSPKRGEKSRDLLWALAHFLHTWQLADRRTAWKLGRALGKGRPIAFAVFPSVDELGHVHGLDDERPAAALRSIDEHLARELGDFAGDIVLSADHGLTATHEHLDLRRLVEERVGPTMAFPLVAMPEPQAVVCESGNAMANVYLRGENGWSSRPGVERTRRLARDLAAIPGIDSVALRGEEPRSAELFAGDRHGVVAFRSGRFSQDGPAFSASFSGADPREALARSYEDERPDAPFALVSLLESDRAGDLLVSANVGHDLRTRREWPEHHASHGALHRAHTVVPVRSSAPLPEGPLRTVDVFAHVLRLARVPLERYGDSDAALLAAGSWEPGAARPERS